MAAQGADNRFGEVDLFCRLVDREKALADFPEQRLTTDRSAGLPATLVARDRTAYVVWDGIVGCCSSQPLLGILNRDSHGDGLSNFDELLLGTDPQNPDMAAVAATARRCRAACVRNAAGGLDLTPRRRRPGVDR